jgi:hypothetical protein
VYKNVFVLHKKYFSYRFDRRDEAQQAINSLNGVIPENGTEPLVVKIAEEHGKQKAAYYAGWQAGYNQSRGKYHVKSLSPFIHDFYKLLCLLVNLLCQMFLFSPSPIISY